MHVFKINSTKANVELHTVLWEPTDRTPVGILQIITGMAEYIERYTPLADYLTTQGWVVIGHDHLGQGHSVQSLSELGYFGQDGAATLLADSLKIGEFAQERYPELPLCVLGHSMGSMLATQYLKQASSRLSGVIFIGVIDVPAVLKVGLPVIRLIAKKAPHKPGNVLNRLAFGIYPQKFDRRRPFSWLSYNLDNVSAYEQNPLCGYTFTNNGFATLFTIAQQSRQTDWFATNQTFPMLVLSGQDDPAGGNGRRARQLTSQFNQAQLTAATVQILPHTAHEILQETTAPITFQKIASWLSIITS